MSKQWAPRGPPNCQKPSIVCQERSCGGPWGAWVWMNGLCTIQGMYHNTRSCVRVIGQYSEEFGVGVAVHQDFVLSPLLSILVLEVLSRMFRTGMSLGASLCWWTGAHCGHPGGVYLKVWKAGMESKGLHVNTKTNFMVSGVDLDVLQKAGKYPCALYCKGVRSATWSCGYAWGAAASLVDWWLTQTTSAPGLTTSFGPTTADQVDIEDTKLDVEATFCYLDDMLWSSDRWDGMDTYSVPRLVSNLSQTYRFPAPRKTKKGMVWICQDGYQWKWSGWRWPASLRRVESRCSA